MNSVFSEQILADKLSKLNNTQQCIETLSHWCIFHRSKAELVVTTWEKQFHSSEMAQKVPLLYLANDILQNSKRKGNEFVNEFWKVLPAALKNVIEKGDDRGKNVVSRLVNIWEERRVFGSREKSLKDVMLGAELPAPLELNKKRPRAIRIVKRDSRSIRTKLSIGGAAEKIVSAYHLVLSEHPIEDIEMNKCKAAVNHVRKIEKDVDAACTSAKDPNRKNLSKELEGEEILLQQCIDKLKLVEASRVALVARLREALHEQESELENVRTQMQVAHAQVGEASSMRNRLNDENYIAVSKPVDANAKVGQAPKRSASALAAAVADKLTASTSSQLIMSSVLSTFAAQEAKNAELTKSSTTSNSSSNAFMLQPNPYQLVAQSTMPAQAQAPISQPQYQLVPNPPSQQYMQPSGTIVNPYGYSSIPPLPSGPPPPPLQTRLAAPMMPLNQQPLQMGQQPPVPPSFRPLQPPAMAYYGHVQNSQ